MFDPPRKHVVSVRLNDDEFKYLQMLAGKGKLSDVLRQRLMNPPYTVDFSTDNRTLNNVRNGLANLQIG